MEPTDDRFAPVARAGVLLALAALVLVGLAACGPEAARVRGGGPGADPGNRGAEVQLQGDVPEATRVYFETPRDEPPIATE